MAESLLHYTGLKPGQHSWYYNRRGGQVTVLPGEWVRIDPDRHPEVHFALEVGAATLVSAAPVGVEILDEDSDPNRERNPYGKVFGPLPPTRQRSWGRRETLALTVAEIDVIAHRFLPWPGWEKDLRMARVDARQSRRGAKPWMTLSPPFDRSFPLLYRLAVLKARQVIADHERSRRVAAREAKASDEYDFKTAEAARKFFNRKNPLPDRASLVVSYLREWNIWASHRLPDPRTMRLYRAQLGPDIKAIEYIDEQILRMRSLNAQRILLPASQVFVGPWVRDKGASMLQEYGKPVGCILLDVIPAYDVDPGCSKRSLELHMQIVRPRENTPRQTTAVRVD